MTLSFTKTTIAAAGALAFALSAASTASAADIVCLITKTDTNPFFVKMKEGAEAKANELLRSERQPTHELSPKESSNWSRPVAGSLTTGARNRGRTMPSTSASRAINAAASRP